MKKWRIARHHPEDRYEPADDVADSIRDELRDLQSRIDSAKITSELNQLFLNQRKLRVDLAERLYGK